jgi:hypothetical protein
MGKRRRDKTTLLKKIISYRFQMEMKKTNTQFLTPQQNKDKYH